MSDIIPEYTPKKQCTGPCGRLLPSTTEFFHRHKRMKDGLTIRCKTCRKEETQAYYSRPEVKEHKKIYDKIYQSQPETKERSRITHQARRNQPEIRERQNTQARIRYHQPNTKKRRSEAQRAYHERPEIRERRQLYSQKYYRSHLKAYMSTPEYRQYQRDWHKAYNNKPGIREHKRDYNQTYLRQPGVEERVKEQKKLYYKTYYPKNRERYNANSRQRRTRNKAVRGTFTHAQIQDLLKRQRYRCYYAACGYAKFKKRNGKYSYHIEHTYPISRAIGTDIPANDISYIVLACPVCNLKKHDKLPHEWPEGGRLL